EDRSFLGWDRGIVGSAGQTTEGSLLDEFLQLLLRQIAVVDHQLVHESLAVRIARAGPLGNPAAALQQRHTGKPNHFLHPRPPRNRSFPAEHRWGGGCDSSGRCAPRRNGRNDFPRPAPPRSAPPPPDPTAQAPSPPSSVEMDTGS